MKVKELIVELQKLDPEIEIYTSSCCYGYQPADGVLVGTDYERKPRREVHYIA